MVYHTSNRSGCLKLASAPQHCCAPTAVHFVPDCPVVVLELPVRMPEREVLLCCTLLLSAGSQIVAAFQRRCRWSTLQANLQCLALAESKHCVSPLFPRSQRGFRETNFQLSHCYTASSNIYNNSNKLPHLGHKPASLGEVGVRE